MMPRRYFFAVSLVAMFAQFSSLAISADTEARWIRPAGAGDHSGKAYGDAATLADLDDMVRLVGPGGTVRLVADDGPYTVVEPITVRHGGKADKSVLVIGVSKEGDPAHCRFIGDRTQPYPTTEAAFAVMKVGSDVFRLAAGADHLTFSGFNFLALPETQWV